jgi:hypothetical protein
MGDGFIAAGKAASGTLRRPGVCVRPFSCAWRSQVQAIRLLPLAGAQVRTGNGPGIKADGFKQ